jgi:hypothetical protein
MTANGEPDRAADAVEAWRCIGCGRIEAPAPCIGVCEDRKVRLVLAADHEAALARLSEAKAAAAALEGVVRRLATTKPRAGAWERSYKALQAEAERALTGLSLARSAADAEFRARREIIEEEP